MSINESVVFAVVLIGFIIIMQWMYGGDESDY
jgi:hypothetical protein